MKGVIGLFQFNDVAVANINTFSSLEKRPNIDFHNVFNEEKVNKNHSHAKIIEELIKDFQRRRALVQKKIAAAIQRIEHEKTLEQIEVLIKDLPFGQRDSIHTAKIARKKIQKGLKKLLAFERYVKKPKKIQELHWMRITAKHLRYTLETFQPFFGRPIVPYINQVANIQALLGRVHDRDVWIKETADSLKLKKFKESKAGLIDLKKECEKSREKFYREFVKLWQQIRQKKIFEKLRKVLE